MRESPWKIPKTEWRVSRPTKISPAPLFDGLRELGHDVLTCREAGMAQLKVPDRQALRFASEQGRIVVTRDRWDFARLHRESKDHAGIIACRMDHDVERQASLIDAALRRFDPLAGKLIRVWSGGFRLDQV
jgi:hypothetical protein